MFQRTTDNGHSIRKFILQPYLLYSNASLDHVRALSIAIDCLKVQNDDGLLAYEEASIREAGREHEDESFQVKTHGLDEGLIVLAGHGVLIREFGRSCARQKYGHHG